jgi:hypothetical protein
MVRQPYATVNCIPQSGTKNLATVHQERVYNVEENPGFNPPFFILYPIKRFLYREPECLSNRQYWVPPPPSRKRVWLPLKEQLEGSQTRMRGGGGEGTQFRRLDRHSGTLPFTLHPTMCRFLDDFRPYSSGPIVTEETYNKGRGFAGLQSLTAVSL